MLSDILNLFENYTSLLLASNLFVLLILATLFFCIRRTKKDWNQLNDYLGNVTKTVDSVRYGDLTKKIESLNIPNSEDLTESLNRMIETLYDREAMVVEYQNELARQNKLLEQTINSLSDALVIIDNKHKILRATQRAAEWFDIDGKKLINRQLDDFLQAKSEKTAPFFDNDEVFIPASKDLNFTARTVELKTEDKRDLYIVIIKDVTNQKELESLKEDFVATLTHDLKVPIIAETNMIDLLLDGNFGAISEKQEFALKNMQSSNRELLDLVQTVLETYKVGKISLNKENIMLKSFLEEIITEMYPIALKTGNKLNFAATRDIRLLADRFQIKRVIKNLIQNAISYGEPKSPIDITIGEIPEYVTIKVKDHGAGIPQKDIEKIFNKYYSASKKFKKIGTGLGLYLALQIVKAHKGDLTVDSKEGEFTEFCIKIPVDYERRFI